MAILRYRRRLLAALVLAATSATLAAQGPPPQQQPTFRSTVDLVAVDVNVIDATGRPVSDLTREEFSLTVDGRPRRVRSAEFVSLSTKDDERREPATYSTNLDRPPGRLIVLVIDQANIRRGTGRETFKAAAKFVDSLTASDRVALHIIPGTGPIADFTSNHAFVKTMLERAVGQGGEADGTGRVGISEAIAATQGDENTWTRILERECVTPDDPNVSPECRQRLQRAVNDVYSEARATTNMSLISMRSILDRLALTTESKTIVLISEGLVVDRNQTDLTWIAPQMAAAHATLYGVRLSAPLYMATMARTSPSREADQQMLLTGMDDLVGRGGGAVFPVGGNADLTFARVSREISAYYLLAFEPEADDRDGRNHDISVKVTRRGVSVRARPTFASPAPGAANTTRDLLTNTLRSALSAADFGVRISTSSYQDETSGRVKVILGADIDRVGATNAPVALAYYVSKLGGDLVWADEEKALAAPSPASRSQHFMGAFVLDPGTYVVKFAVVDDLGRRASVERQFDAKVASIGQVRMGDLMLARLGEVPGKLRPVIDGRVESDAIIAYTEMYSQAAQQLAGATARVEIAESEDGRALESAAMTLGSAQKDKRTAQGALTVSQLNDGNYIVRAVLEMAGRDLGRVVQPFTIARGANRNARPEPAAADASAAATPAKPEPTFVPPLAAPIVFESRMDRFERRSVFARPVIGFFIDRLRAGGAPPVPESLLPAVGLARIGRFVEAAKVVEASGSDHVAGRFLAGLADLADGRLNDAATKFAAVLKQTPGYFPATFYLGATYAAGSQDREAVEVWRSAIVKTRSAPWTYTLLADALMRVGDNARALDVLREASRAWPTNDDVMLRWGTILSKTGQGDEAARALAPYLSNHMDDTDRLFLAMRHIYEARYSRRWIESTEADRVRFGRYYDAYVEANGPERALAAQWKKVMDR